MKVLEREIIERISHLIGGDASSFTRVHDGYSPAARWIFEANGLSFFAKVGTTTQTSKHLRREILAYDRIRGDFMPIRIASADHESAPILILEDLSDYHWPPPWRHGQVDAVLDQIANIHESSADLPTFGELHGQLPSSWQIVADDTRPFLSLGLVSHSWLQQSLPQLLEAESQCATEGHAVTHWDIRSNKICIRKPAIKLIDWNNACLGNPKLDLAFWLPSLANEGGPRPESVLGDEPEIAACVSGFFAARAGLREIHNAPRVRLVQRQQLGRALPWATHALDLPALN